MAKGHKGKVAVITGAASGLGQAFSHRLAEEGVKIVCADIQSAEKTLEMIKAVGGEAIAVKCDITNPADVAALGDQAKKHFGGVDILVNNAGIYPMKSFEEMTFEDWRRVMSVNLDSMFLTCKQFVPGMRERGWGRIVNLASNTFGMVVYELVHYVASKGGVIGFTRALASDLATHGVTVNAIGPSLTRTPGTTSWTIAPGGMQPEQMFAMVAGMQAINRIEEPPDLVGAISFLTSDDCAFITGQTLYVDGGLVRGA
jgi:NAD(P)-dependent dehydrogenase (short-subunit alcohol dehydrogenase family)